VIQISVTIIHPLDIVVDIKTAIVEIEAAAAPSQ
jgi:hypothetical protein